MLTLERVTIAGRGFMRNGILMLLQSVWGSWSSECIHRYLWRCGGGCLLKRLESGKLVWRKSSWLSSWIFGYAMKLAFCEGQSVIWKWFRPGRCFWIRFLVLMADFLICLHLCSRYAFKVPRLHVLYIKIRNWWRFGKQWTGKGKVLLWKKVL